MWFKVIFLASFCFQFSLEFPGGGGTSACSTLMPSHGGVLPQVTDAPVAVTFSSPSIEPGQILTLNVISTQPGILFRGIMIQARTLNDEETIFGQFIESDDIRAVNCAALPPGSVATHRTNQDRSVYTLQWQAPTSFDGLPLIMRFHFTVVQEVAIFWTGIVSPMVILVPPTSPEIPVETTTNPPVEEINVYEGCGVTKVCFGGPESGCLQNANCDFFGAVLFRDGQFTFELLSEPGASYIAMALSTDDRMGSDSVIECVRQNDQVQAFTSFTVIGPNEEDFGSPRDNINQQIIRYTFSQIVNGRIYCLVDRNTVSVVQGKTFNLINQTHYLLLASGEELRVNSVGNHFESSAFTDNAVNLTIPANLEAGRRVLVAVHGSLMVAAWIGTASIGIFLARYYRDTWTTRKLCGKDVWFVWHLVSMVLTWAFTIAAFIIIFVDVGAWRTSVHSITGTTVFVLVLLQPIGAILRPKPAASNRPIFDLLHFSFGNIAHVLAIITIFYAVPLVPAGLPEWTSQVIVAFVVFYLLMHITMATIKVCGEVKRSSKVGSSKYPPFRLLSKTLLGFFVMTIVFFVVTLILIISLQP